MAVYIPPNNTSYYKDEYLDTLDKSRKIYIVGDLNSRCNNKFPDRGYDYILNPDPTMNQNGRLTTKQHLLKY